MTATFSKQTPTSCEALKLSGVILDLSMSVSASQLDDEYAKACKSGIKKPFLFDFSNATFIDIAVLSVVTSIFNYRYKNGYFSYIALPKCSKVRLFLNLWRFYEAINDATSLTHNQYIIEENTKQYEYDNLNFDKFYDKSDNPFSNLEYNSSHTKFNNKKRNFFEITTYKGEYDSKSTPYGLFLDAPRLEGRRWSGTLISTILKNCINNYKEVARTIIYEATSNAIKHPKADVVHFSSKNYPASNNLKKNSKRKVDSWLRFCFWDNGATIYETLKNGAESNGTIRSFSPTQNTIDHFIVKIKSRNSASVQEKKVSSDENLDNILDKPAHLLLASLYAGVSCDPKKRLPDPPKNKDNDCETNDVLLNNIAGMGLNCLLHCVVRNFEGKFKVRTGKFLMEVKLNKQAGNGKYQFKVEITEVEGGMPSFNGNLLDISIPLLRRKY